ncbi:MAG: Ig-like domain-containing protein [Psychroflexus sp.]
MGCERDISDDAVLATFPRTAEVFIDAPIGMGSNFYFPYADSKATAWSVDEDESYQGLTSMRIDVPNENDPAGSYAGAILRIDGSGRDLTGFDALTFWARASQGVTIGEFGLGEDFNDNTYLTTITNVSLGTAWQKVIIPLPDPSVLTEESGMFRYAAGTNGTGGSAYTIWVDELQFEKLGTIAQPRPAIQNGEDIVTQNFIGGIFSVTGLTQTLNTTTGDVTTVIASSFFEFSSSNENVATVNQDGQVSVIGSGTAVITATLGDEEAQGSLTVESLGDFIPAPVPTRDSENVISIFSDAYNNVPVDYYNGFFNGDGQTTQGGTGPNGADISVDGDGIINYTDLNFVGIGTFMNVPPINATSMSHLHVDINVNEEMTSGDFIRLQLINNVGGNETSGSVTLTNNELTTNEWEGFDIPLSQFSGLSDRSQIGLLFFISDSSISDIYVDNIYFYSED